MTDDGLTEADADGSLAPEFNNLYGFQWGSVEVTRMIHVDGKGRTVNVRPVGSTYDAGITVYVSEGGRSVRAFKNGRELR